MKKSLPIIVLGTFLSVCTLFARQYQIPENNPGREQDSLALVAVRDHITAYVDNYPSKTDFFASWYDRPMEEWRYITLDPITGRVTGFHFGSSIIELKGELPSEFGNLSELRSFDAFFYDDVEGLTTLPEAFGRLQKLEYFSVYNGNIETLPESFGDLSSLRTLRIENCALKQLPASLGSLRALETLFLSGNMLSSLPASFPSLSHLKTAILNNNHLIELPTGMGQLEHLERLGLNRNNLSSLPEDFGEMPKLNSLALERNRFTSLSSQIAYLQGLQFLFAGNNPLEGSIPVSFLLLDKLVTFKTDNTQLCIPDDPRFEEWKRTITNGLGLPKCDFDSPCEYIDTELLKSMSSSLIFGTDDGNGEVGGVQAFRNAEGCAEKLYFVGDIRGDIGPEIGLLIHLKSIESFAYNQYPFGKLPEELGNLSELESIDLFNAGLASLPESVGNLKKLKRISMKRGSMKKVPESIGELKNLEVFKCVDCNIESLPSTMGRMRNLRLLNLFDNKLKSIPDELAYLYRLEDIKLGYNQLERFPKVGAYGYSQLKYISFGHNSLTGPIPVSYKNLKRLEGIAINNNDLCRTSDPDFNAWVAEKGFNEGYGNIAALPLCPVSFCQERDSRAMEAIRSKLSFGQGPYDDYDIDVQYNEEGCMDYLRFYGDITGDLPAELGQLKDLVTLEHFSYDQRDFGKLPKEVSQLTKLEKFYFHGATGVTLDSSLLQLPKLKSLRLEWGALKEAPEHIALATELELLSLSNNRGLRKLPLSLMDMGKMNRLELDGCPLVCFPDDLDFVSWLDARPANFLSRTNISFCTLPTSGTEGLRTVVEEETSVPEEVKVAPNPAQDYTEVFFELYGNQQMIEFRLFDAMGQTVLVLQKAMSSDKGSLPIDVSNLAEGLYTYNLVTNKGIVSKKLMIRR